MTIETIRRTGVIVRSSRAGTSHPGPVGRQMIDDDLTEIWEQAKPTLLGRCETVRRAAAAADGAAHDEARADAHKLAGAVGMFGLDDASALALELDRLIVGGALDDDRRDHVATLATELAAALEGER